jgi:hypothetical protein
MFPKQSDDTIAVKEIAMPLRDHFRPPVSKKNLALDLEQSYEQACSDLWIS